MKNSNSHKSILGNVYGVIAIGVIISFIGYLLFPSEAKEAMNVFSGIWSISGDITFSDINQTINK